MVTQYSSREGAVLIPGCGNSKLAEDMHEDGYGAITSVDISKTVVQQMSERYAEKIPGLTFTEMDVKAMSFPEGEFDCVIDKACFDSILCGEGSGPNADIYLAEIHRVLKPDGTYICVTYGEPEIRLSYFNDRSKFDWTVTTHRVAKQTAQKTKLIAEAPTKEQELNKYYHFVYVM